MEECEFYCIHWNLSRDVRRDGSIDASVDTLRLAESRVKAVISDRFDEAVAAGDLASVERFFKLFPLVNMHQEGLEKFTTKHLCIKLVNGSTYSIHIVYVITT